jgi:hypothetical protein
MASKFSQTADSTVLLYSTSFCSYVSGVLDHGSCSTYATLGIATYCTAHELLKQAGFTVKCTTVCTVPSSECQMQTRRTKLLVYRSTLRQACLPVA